MVVVCIEHNTSPAKCSCTGLSLLSDFQTHRLCLGFQLFSFHTLGLRTKFGTDTQPAPFLGGDRVTLHVRTKRGSKVIAQVFFGKE